MIYDEEQALVCPDCGADDVVSTDEYLWYVKSEGGERMNKTNNGGPAFPVQSIYVEDQDTNSPGMTLRDYFAAKALQGFAASTARNNPTTDQIAQAAYALADAMLRTREANNG